MKIDTAMILAAGRGERLKPITDDTPKSMCLVHTKPLIEHHISQLKRAGIKHAIINHAYLGYKIREYLGTGKKFGLNITYSPEPPGALETAGGIINALPKIGASPFLVVNADIYTNFDYKNLHISEKHLAHLVLVNKPDYLAHADFGLTQSNLVSNENPFYTFAGIGCYHPQLFNQYTLGRYGLAPLLKTWVSDHKVSGQIYHGDWVDIGTPERLSKLNL